MELYQIKDRLKQINEEILRLKNQVKEAEEDIIILNEKYGDTIGDSLSIVDLIRKWLLRYDIDIDIKKQEVKELEKEERALEVNLAAVIIVAKIGVEWGKNSIGEVVTKSINERLDKLEQLDDIKEDMLKRVCETKKEKAQ